MITTFVLVELLYACKDVFYINAPGTCTSNMPQCTGDFSYCVNCCCCVVVKKYEDIWSRSIIHKIQPDIQFFNLSYNMVISITITDLPAIGYALNGKGITLFSHSPCPLHLRPPHHTQFTLYLNILIKFHVSFPGAINSLSYDFLSYSQPLYAIICQTQNIDVKEQGKSFQMISKSGICNKVQDMNHCYACVILSTRHF